MPPAPHPPTSTPTVQLGLRPNLSQFGLLVLINLFVGGMVGVQRTVVPLLGQETFHLASTTAILSFIATFGLVKALANLFAGPLAERFGRRRILIFGWILGLPVPFLIIAAPSWSWIIAANALLGLNQGLAWSMTVNMKIDLVGPRRRGLALGLNEFAGYTAVGATAWITGLIAAEYGLRPAPFYLAIGYAVAGLTLSILAVRDTTAHLRHESAAAPPHAAPAPSFSHIFALTTYRNRSLFACSQAGFINNLNDGVAWGILPLLLAARGLSLPQIGLVAGLYPLIWGLGQLGTGILSDTIGRKPLIVWGMLVQAAAHVVFGFGAAQPLGSGILGATLLGLGTAMVYPTLLAAISDTAHPSWRASALSVYRFWRDLGFAAGALLTGLIADSLGLTSGVHAAGLLTFLSGLAAWRLMRSPHQDAAASA